MGERIKKINQNGLTTNFHYGFNGDLLFEKDQAGNTKEYVWLNGRPLARIDNGTVIYYYHVDHLGTPQVMTDAAGAIKWRADYEPFGKATVKVATVENNLRLPGQYFDRETGLHYNYFRDYDPTTGRYVEADPIGLAGGMNLYSYVGGNPVNAVDPEGLASQGNFPGSSCGPEGNPNNFPNNWTGNYEPACNWHDWCYSQCRVTKEYCDAAFYQQMRSSCSKVSTSNDFLGATKSLCQRQALAYHFAVDNFGQKAFDKAQEHCQCQK